MKKFTKVCLITALVLILAGGSLCLVGVVTGGFRLLTESRYDGSGYGRFWARMSDGLVYGARHGWEEGWYDEWRENREDVKIREDVKEDWDDAVDGIAEEWEDAAKDASENLNDVMHDMGNHWEDDWDDDWNEDWDHWEHHEDHPAGDYLTISETGYIDTELTGSEITDLVIDLGGAGLYLRPSKNGGFGLEKSGSGQYRYCEENGVLYIQGIKGKHYNSAGPKLYVYIPEEMDFRSASVYVGGGKAELGELSAQELKLAVGAGKVTADRISGREASVDIGAGEARLDGLSVEKLEMNVGVGSAEVSGSVTGKLDIECGMGGVTATLSQKEEDFNYELESSAGNIVIGSKSYTAAAGKKYIDNGAWGESSLECAMGSIQLKFGHS